MPALSSEPTIFGISARMARALADPWRIRILSELSVRALSPSRFVTEIGGELTEVARCFRQLADWGYIELLEERPGRQNGAAIEHVYVGVHRAHFDTAAWQGVPRSEREKASRSILDSYFARISEAVEAGTFDQEVDRHLSWDTVVLDRLAWTELGQRLDDLLDRLPYMENDSMTRLCNPNDDGIPTIVGLTLFRSPQPPGVILQAPRRPEPIGGQSPSSSLYALPPKMATALSNRWRCRILMELTARPLSPSEFVEQIGGKMSNISRCFRQLAGWGYIEVVEERKGGRRGGGIEKRYRNTKRAYFDAATWESLPRLIRNEVSSSFLGSYYDRIREAVDSRTFDAETDRHLSWTPVTVDRQAWVEIGQDLEEILCWLPDLEAESVERVGGNLDRLIPTIAGLLSFRSPKSFVTPHTSRS